MNRVNYDVLRNEVIVTGCYDCPFCHYHERFADYRPFCCLDPKIDIEDLDEVNSVIKYFPIGCPLKNQYFKITTT
ncbi:MAG: hypothetical protein ACOCRK_00955 [bacterium]